MTPHSFHDKQSSRPLSKLENMFGNQHPPPTVYNPVTRRVVQWLIFSSWFLGCFPAHSADRTPEYFFGTTQVWTLHLTLSPEAWKALEPVELNTGPGREAPPRFRPGADENLGEGPGPRRGRGPGGPGGPGGFGPRSLHFPWATATLECDGQILTNVALRFKGNSSFNGSRQSLKKPLKLDFNRGAKGRRFFGLKELALGNNVNELAHLREPIAYQVFQRAGLPASRTAYVRLYLTLTGEFENRYLGLYTAVEPVDGAYLKRTLGTSKGLLVKPERVPGIVYLGEDWRAYTNRYEVHSESTESDTRQLIRFARFVNEAPDTEFTAELKRYVDIDATLRFIAINAWLANMDSFLGNGHNYYLFIAHKDGRAHFIPWDLNEAFGGHPMAGSSAEQTGISVLHPPNPGNRLAQRLLETEPFRTRYREILGALRTNAIKPEAMIATAKQIDGATREALADDPLRRRSQEPGDRPPPPGFGRGRMQPLPFDEWVRRRDEAVQGELAGTREGTVPRMNRPVGPPRPLPER